MADDIILRRWLMLALPPALLVLAVVLWTAPQRLAPLYYGVMGLLGWVAFGQGRWRRAQDWLQRLPGPVWLRFLALGYGAVVAEETLVGLAHAGSEGSAAAVLPRIGQFVLFNLFAFSGAIWGMGLAYGRWPGLRPWHWLLAGAWGLFAERTWWFLWTNPIAGVILIAPNMVVYAVILAPMMLSLPTHDAPPAKQWALPLVWALMLALSVPPVAALIAWRGAWPDGFPSCDYIAC